LLCLDWTNKECAEIWRNLVSEKLKDRLEEVRENLFRSLLILNFEDILLFLSLDVSNQISLSWKHALFNEDCFATLDMHICLFDVLCMGQKKKFLHLWHVLMFHGFCQLLRFSKQISLDIQYTSPFLLCLSRNLETRKLEVSAFHYVKFQKMKCLWEKINNCSNVFFVLAWLQWFGWNLH